VLSGGAYLEAPPIGAYDVGALDFSVEAWVRSAPAGGAGTIVARKGPDGGSLNGGFLLVLQPDGSLKLATDDGYGYTEFITVPTRAADGAWHHVAGVRQGVTLLVYLDGIVQAGSPKGNRPGPLNVNNRLPLTLGTTQQTHERYRALSGQLGAVTLWSGARSAAQVVDDMRSPTRTDAGLVGYWSFDAQDGADSSPHHNAATPRGAVTYTAPGAPLGGEDVAARLGSSSSFLAPSNPAYQFGRGDFTVEAWARTAQAGGSGTIVSRKGTSGGSSERGGFLLVLQPDGSLKLATDDGYGFHEGYTAATAANDGRWHYLAGVRQGAAIQIYVDGLPVETRPRGNRPPPLDVDDALPLTLGTTQQTHEPYRQLNGDLGTVALWRGARDAAAIWSDMRTVLQGGEPGLAGLWSFRYRNGLDLTPVRNNAAPTGTPSYVTPGPPIGWFAAATTAQGFLQAPSNAAYQLGKGDFTLEAWVRVAQPGSGGTLIARKGTEGGAPGRGGFLLVLQPDGSLKLATDDGYGFAEVVSAATAAADGAWHHVAGVRRGAQLELLLDGRPLTVEPRGNRPPPLDVSCSEPLTLAAALQESERHRFLSGQLDAVALWLGARSREQIAADANTHLSGREPGLIGLWSFDFRDGRDSSPTRNAAAVVGAVSFPAPGAPIGQLITQAPTLTAVEDDGQRLVVHWTAVAQPAVTGYRLTLFDAAGQPLASIEGTATEGELPPPAGAGTYVRARALASLGAGPWSAPLPVVGAAPGALAVDVGDAAIAARWDATADATMYHLELLDGTTVVESRDVAATAGELALPADRSRVYAVRVRGLAGTPPLSAGPASAPVPVILDAPQLLSVAYDGTTVALTWTALSPAPPGRYRAAVFDGTVERAAVDAPGTEAQLPVELDPARSYVARVRALGDRSNGPWSAPVAIVSAPPAAVVAGAEGANVAARWKAAENAAGYEAALQTDGTWGDPQPTSSPAIAFAAELAAGALYAVRVRTRGAAGHGPWSAPVPGPFLRAGHVRYDGVGRMTRIELPGVGTTVYDYDEGGNVTTVTVTEDEA
jgi:YD repeat-containing protein